MLFIPTTPRTRRHETAYEAAIPSQLRFPGLAGFTVRAHFDGGAVSIDFGALLLQGVGRQSGLIYSTIHNLGENTLCHTELARAQPMSTILKLYKLADKVVQLMDIIKLHLPGACLVKALLHRITELLYLVRPAATA